jgi:hypothetical protein
MTYFEDLSRYTYQAPSADAVPLRNVGWLDADHEFRKEEPTPQLLDAIWEHCSTQVIPTRGLHCCEICAAPTNLFTRHGTKLLLGSGEIRVFNAAAEAFAAPNLIYHYILDHHYRPPEQFLQAIEGGPHPRSQEYRQLLERLGGAWRENAVVLDEPAQIQFVRTEDGVEVKKMEGEGKS